MADATVVNSDRVLVVAACFHRPFLERADKQLDRVEYTVRSDAHPEHVFTVVRYLLGKRPFNGELGGLWEMPGGKVHENETIHHALVREINEELGWSDIVPEIPEVLYKADVDFPHGKFRVIFINVVVGVECEDVPMLIEHLGLMWWTLFDLKEMGFNGHLTPATKSMVEFLLAGENRPE